MKVLMMISYPEFGGTETHVLSLCRTLRALGVQVGVATFGGPFVPCLRKHQIPVHYMSTIVKSNSPQTVASVLSIVKANQYDMIHAHDSESFRMLPRLKQVLPQTPLIMTVHGKYVSRNNLRRAASAAKLIITVTPSIRKWVVNTTVQSAQKVCWIPNGIDTRKYAPVNATSYKPQFRMPPTSKVCLYAGRFQADKVHIAVKFILAAERVAATDKNFVALLVGFGSYRSRLMRMAKFANSRIGRTAIYVLPHTAHIDDYYHLSTLVVGTGRVALEALSCGKPVIAVGVAGYDGIVTPTTLNQVIADHFGDHAAHKPFRVASLTDDIKTLMTKKVMAERYGRHGRKIVVRRFSMRRIGSMTYRSYLNVKR